MIVKTSAIALRLHPYTETSRVVTWLTPERGRINTLLKGALRPKSPFLGQVDLFYTCELLYYAKAHDGLPVTRECTALSARPGMRRDWRACALASYLSALVSRAAPEQATRHDVYHWLEQALDDAAIHSGSAAVLCWQELHLLDLLGHAPRLGDCLDCRSAAPDAEVAFSIPDGGWRCRRCFEQRAPREALWIPGPAVRQLAAWQTHTSPNAARAALLPYSQQAALERLLGLFIGFHLDVAPSPRAAALDILGRQPARPVDRTGSLR